MEISKTGTVKCGPYAGKKMWTLSGQDIKRGEDKVNLYEMFIVDGEELDVVFHDYVIAKNRESANRIAAVRAAGAGIDVEKEFLTWKAVEVCNVDVPEKD